MRFFLLLLNLPRGEAAVLFPCHLHCSLHG
jgi:hypothetical protein